MEGISWNKVKFWLEIGKLWKDQKAETVAQKCHAKTARWFGRITFVLILFSTTITVVMQGIVRELYKRILTAGVHYPQGLNYIRERAKTEFFKNKDLTTELDIKKAVAYGRYQVREIEALSKFHKYRTIRKRYGWNDE